MVLGLVRQLLELSAECSAWSCFGLVPGVPGRQLDQRRQLRPLRVPQQQLPGLPEQQHGLPPCPQFSPVNQQERAERPAEGWQGGAERTPARPEWGA